MATASVELVVALRETAQRLSSGVKYNWSLMGSCNCGHLAQTITGLDSREIQSRALERSGDWSDQVESYCSSSGLSLDDIFNAMLRVGMSKDDIKHLEHLSDPQVLERMQCSANSIKKNSRDDLVTYMNCLADLLEAQLIESLPLPPSQHSVSPSREVLV